MDITEVVYCGIRTRGRLLHGVLEPGSDLLGKAQLIHLVNEEREIQKGFVTCPKFGSRREE